MAATNTDEVFEAEAEAEAWADKRSHLRSRQSYQEGQSKKPMNGAGDQPVYEETPLLERDSDGSGESSASDNGDERGAPEWSGARDFEGIPWWRKPSVS